MKPFRFTLISLFLVVPTVAFAQSTDEWSAAVLKSLERRQPIPAMGADSYNATERQAYEVQKIVVEKLIAGGDEPVGHKAGLTSEAAQAKFDVFEPVAGALLKSHVKNTGTFVSRRQFKGMMVEMEIGFELKLSIRAEPRDVEELKSKVRQILPIVELPNIHFDPSDKVSGLDVIASNVAAATVIKGRAKPIGTIDLNEIEATLTLDKEVIAEGVGSDAMGDQWEALLWLVRQRLRDGYEVKRNDLLITGALGQVVPAESGRYVADFGKLGRVTFSMR
ncbi:MAG: 4-oxalocrotonate decarboxylase [Opitutaceae bacterium]|nr:4-oxalocrotonate decarboxylase [Opitutaceae bacterium]